MDYILVKDGVVVNRIVASPEFVESIRSDYDSIVECDGSGASPGWTYDGVSFTNPSPPVVRVKTQKEIDREKLKQDLLDFADKKNTKSPETAIRELIKVLL